MNNKKMIVTDGMVVSRKKLSSSIFHIKIKLDKDFPYFEYGNFVMVHLKDNLNTLLPRPFSIFRAEKNNLELIFKEVGKGTGILAVKDLPFSLKIWGPLGNSFPTDDEAILIAGGLGLVPLYQKIIKGDYKKAFVGFKSITEAYFIDNLRKKKTIISTDDGSYGEKGFVTDIFKKFLQKEDFKGKVIACGPNPFLKNLWNIGKEFKELEIYGSFETYMACGFGVCLGCAIETPNGIVKVCKDGPVFKLNDIFGE